MDLGLAGKHAIVLGGSRGIGFYTVAALLQEGARVTLCARGREGVSAAVEQLSEQGEVDGAAVDLADAQATERFVQTSAERAGRLDVLIHNASGFGVDASRESWQRAFDVDVMAGVAAVEAGLPFLRESGDGSIVFVGSMASKYHFGREASAYGPMKAAMRTYANELAQNHGKDGVRANVVSPGAVWFPGGVWDQRKQENPKFYAGVERSIPLGRLGSAEEIANIIAFTASPAGRWLNATHLAADGGQVAAVD